MGRILAFSIDYCLVAFKTLSHYRASVWLVTTFWRVYHAGILQATQAHSAWPSLRG